MLGYIYTRSGFYPPPKKGLYEFQRGKIRTRFLYYRIMIHLSEADKKQAKGLALKVITDNANKVLSDRTSSREDKEKAILAMMSIEWTPDLAKMAGRGSLSRLLQQTRNGFFTNEEYKPFRDMIVHATDSTAPIQHGNWRIWHSLIIRYHLFELADTRQ